MKGTTVFGAVGVSKISENNTEIWVYFPYFSFFFRCYLFQGGLGGGNVLCDRIITSQILSLEYVCCEVFFLGYIISAFSAEKVFLFETLEKAMRYELKAKMCIYSDF